MTDEFSFKAYQAPRSDRNAGEVWVTRTRVNIGLAVYEVMGSPPRIRFSYDLRSKAIKLVSASDGDGLRAVRPKGRMAIMLAVKPKVLGQLPLGAYLPIGGGIFVHESEQR